MSNPSEREYMTESNENKPSDEAQKVEAAFAYLDDNAYREWYNRVIKRGLSDYDYPAGSVLWDGYPVSEDLLKQ